MKKKVWDITVKDNPNRVVMGENDEFYTTDTEAFLVFNLQDKDFNPQSAMLTLENRNDGSLKSEELEIVGSNITWEMPERYIEHSGNWQAQLVYEQMKGEVPEKYTSGVMAFTVKSHIQDKKRPSLVEIENWEKFIREGTELIETWEDLEALREENERQRQTNEQARESAESVREDNETGRVIAETVRSDFYEGFTSELDKKASKLQEGWVAPTMLNGWVNYSETTYVKCGYYKDTLGIVHLRGFIKSGEINKTIFSLPPGYQPEALSYFPTTTYNTTGTITIGSFNGNVTCVHGNNTWITLNGISFKAYR